MSSQDMKQGSSLLVFPAMDAYWKSFWTAVPIIANW